MTYKVRNISVSIERSVNDVYRYASDPTNFPHWVKFITSIRKENTQWVATTDQGEIKIKFSPENEFGILDHTVTLVSGETVESPLRIVSNNDGCEVIFTLFWMPGRSEQEFREDGALVESDLITLKQIMEML